MDAGGWLGPLLAQGGIATGGGRLLAGAAITPMVGRRLVRPTGLRAGVGRRSLLVLTRQAPPARRGPVQSLGHGTCEAAATRCDAVDQ